MPCGVGAEKCVSGQIVSTPAIYYSAILAVIIPEPQARTRGITSLTRRREDAKDKFAHAKAQGREGLDGSDWTESVLVGAVGCVGAASAGSVAGQGASEACAFAP